MSWIGLAAHGAERIDHVGPDIEQAQFEDLEQADRAGADDHGVGFDGAAGSPKLGTVENG